MDEPVLMMSRTRGSKFLLLQSRLATSIVAKPVEIFVVGLVAMQGLVPDAVLGVRV